jgi:hypothetical protein
MRDVESFRGTNLDGCSQSRENHDRSFDDEKALITLRILFLRPADDFVHRLKGSHQFETRARFVWSCIRPHHQFSFVNAPS